MNELKNYQKVCTLAHKIKNHILEQQKLKTALRQLQFQIKKLQNEKEEIELTQEFK